MTENVASLAALNVSLLEAIKAGPAENRPQLAERANIGVSNLNRKLDSLLEAELISKAGEETHQVALTELGARALAANAVWRGEASVEGEPGDVRMIPVDQLDPWPDQPRSRVDPEFLEEITVNIGDEGVLQTLTVRPRDGRYQVVIGETRRQASLLAVARGLQPEGFEVPCKIREVDDDKAFEIALAENVQRDDLHWMDEAKAAAKLFARGKSAAEISRIFGEKRGKRSLNDFIKIARELPEDVLAQAYLPAKLSNGQPNPQCLTYTKAREMVGEKKEKPALELSPKVAMTLIELLVSSGYPTAGGRGYGAGFHLYKPPSGGPIGALQERKLISFRFEGHDIVGRVETNRDDVDTWLQQIGYFDDQEGALFKARAAVMGGELQAGTVGAGHYLTEELNKPAQAELLPAPSPPTAKDVDDPISPLQRRVLREIAARSLHRHRLLGGFVTADAAATDDPDYQAVYDLEFTLHRPFGDKLEIAVTRIGETYLKDRGIAPEEAKSANSCTTPWLRTDQGEVSGDGSGEPLPAIDGESGQEAEAGAPARPVASPPAAPVASQPEAWSLPPMMAIVAIELAHKIASHGVERGPGTWAVEIRESYYKDTRGVQGVQTHRAWAFLPMGRDKTLCALTKRCLDWLAQEYDLAPVGDGRLVLDDEMLLILQRAIVGEPKEGLYSTYWLNEPAKAEAPAGAEPTAPPAGEPAPPVSFSEQIKRVTSEQRAFSSLASAATQAAAALNGFKARTKAPKPEEVDPIVRLLEAAVEAVQPYLGGDAG